MTTISKPAESTSILALSHDSNYHDHDSNASISGSSSTKSTDQYYTFLNPEVKRSLHVIDADYGVFESKKKPKKVFNLKAPNLNFMKKEKESYYNSNYKDNMSATLLGLGDGSGDYENLRAEPELVDTYMNRPRRSIMRPTNPARIPYRVVEDSDIEMNNSSTSDVDSKADYSEAPSIYNYQPERQQSFAPPKIPQLDSQQTKRTIKSATSSPTKNSIVKTLTKIAKSSMTPTPATPAPTLRNTLMDEKQENLDLIKNYKSKIEEEYEIAQLRAAKYRAERDKMRVKLKNQQMAQKLREYEFYCVNGIDHEAIESDSRAVFGKELRKREELLERRRQQKEQQRILQEMQFHLEQQQRQEQAQQEEEEQRRQAEFELERQAKENSSFSRRRRRMFSSGLLTPPSSMKTPPQLMSEASFRTTENNSSIKTKSLDQLPSTTNSSLFEKLSSNLPPEAKEFVDYYVNYIPTIGTISDFHDEVLVYIRTTPLISLVYPFYLLLKHLIPKTSSKEQRSLRALFVGICDVFMLVVIGFLMWYFFKYAFMIISVIFKISHYLRII